jgi:hypothetical protein
MTRPMGSRVPDVLTGAENLLAQPLPTRTGLRVVRIAAYPGHGRVPVWLPARCKRDRPPSERGRCRQHGGRAARSHRDRARRERSSVSVLAESPALLEVDGIVVDVSGNVWAAVMAQSTIVRVSPSGVVTTVATAADGLDWASSIAFGKNGDLWAVSLRTRDLLAQLLPT